MVDAKVDWRIMAKMEKIATAKDYEEQQVVFLALKASDVLEKILKQQGWNPTQQELNKLEKAVINYVLSYRKSTKNYIDEWNIVLGNYVLKRKGDKQNGGNRVKRQIEKSKEVLYRNLKEIGVMNLFQKAPVFSIVMTSYLNETEQQKSKRKKSILTRTNVVKYSYGYGADHQKVFEEVIPL